jgi:hypothetical protein
MELIGNSNLLFGGDGKIILINGKLETGEQLDAWNLIKTLAATYIHTLRTIVEKSSGLTRAPEI